MNAASINAMGINAAIADQRADQARREAIDKATNDRANYIQAEVLKAEFACRAQDISDLIGTDEDFASDLCAAVASIVRNPRNLTNLHHVINAFDHAIERKAAAEFDEWRAAA